MGCTYKRKTIDKYTSQQLNHALNEIKSGSLTINAASKKHKIPYMTLSSRIRQIRGAKSLSRGRRTALSQCEEAQLANGLKILEKWGWGLSRKEVLDLVQTYVEKAGIETPFKNNRPGEDWFLNFKRRQNLSLKTPQSIEIARKNNLDPKLIEKYFNLLERTLDEFELASKPERIYNMDESSFSTDPSKTKVVGARGKPSCRTVSGSGRENITVLFGANAKGEKLPPLIIFKGKHMWNEWIAPENQGFPDTAYAASQNGWMESDIFLNYFKNTFIKSIGKERPVLLIYDGHSTHINLGLIKLAIDENISIIKLPAHSSHILQPMDLSVFRSLKQTWDEKLVSWQRRNIGKKLPKKQFSKIIGEIWASINPDIIKSGFRKGGIYPFNKYAVPSEYLPSSLPLEEQNTGVSIPLSADYATSSTANQQKNTEVCNQNDVTVDVETFRSTEKLSFETLLLQKVSQAPRETRKARKNYVLVLKS